MVKRKQSVKQRQSQHQKVVINMGNSTTRKRRRKNKAPLRSATSNVIKHVHSYGNNIFQANLERERADITREMNILRSERQEINKLKAIEEKKKHQGVFASQAELKSGTTPTKSQYNDLVSNIAPKTPKGSPPNDGRNIKSNKDTIIPGYATPTASSMGRTLNMNDL